jgi:plastocyanin
MFVLVLGVLAMVALPGGRSEAKGAIDKITITHSGWAAPVEVTTGETLELLSPWRDDFLGEHLASTPGVTPDNYQVSIYLNNGGRNRQIYTLWYYRESAEGRDFVGLPGRGEPGFDLNQSTIIRSSGFYEATTAWTRFMDEHTAAIRPPVTGEAGLLPAGGGGCHGSLTDGAATRVEIVMSCYGPTISRVEAGDTVTWVNHDQAIHNVYSTGQDWSDGSQLLEGASVTAKFNRSGIFPYVCTFHPGMVGVVVVGEGSASAAAYEPAPVGREAVGPPAANGSDESATISHDGGNEGKKLALAGLAVGGSAVGLVAAGWLAFRR